MPTPVIMPKFGMAQEEGTIIRWLKQAGDAVVKGETILEVQTDKIDMEVEAPVTGILAEIRYGVDATVPVTTTIASIVQPGERAAPAAIDAPAPPKPAAPVEPLRASPVAQRMAAATGIDLAQVAGTGPAGRITKGDVANAVNAAAQVPSSGSPAVAGRLRATPAARQLARTQQFDLAAVAGSGPDGRIQAADVAAAIADAANAGPPGRTGPEAVPAAGAALRGRRKTIATRLSQSWQTIPHIFLTASIELTRVDAVTAELSAEVEASGGRLTPTVWIARATAAALQRHPRLNAWLQQENGQWMLREHAAVDLGLAVAVEDGLLVPVVRNAERLGLAGLAAAIADLATRARAGQVRPDEVTGSTFSISNLGMYPVDQFTAIINPPEVAILAVGRAQMQPVWTGAAFEPRRIVQVTLSADHRAVDGAAAAAFLAELKRLLEEPARLLL